MALIIEDGTGKPDSNTYVTDAEFTAFAAGRGIVLPGTAELREPLLLKAIDFLETLDFVGYRKTRAQALAWPRTDVSISGFAIPDTEIPRELKSAQLQLAADAQTVDLLPTTPAPTAADKGAVIEESVEGAVSVKYAAPAAPVASLGIGPGGAVLARASALLRGLLRGAGAGLFQVRVGRG